MENQKLSDWAKQNGMTYSKAYNWQKNGKLPVDSYKDEGGTIRVGSKPSYQATANVQELSVFSESNTPLAVGIDNDKTLKLNFSQADTKTRTNRSARIEELDRYANIKKVFIPFSNGQMADESNSNIKEVLRLSIKAYFGYAIVRNVVNTMASFCSSKIYLTGGSKKSRAFFEAYFKSIKLNSFCKQFFREFWKTGNCFIYRHLGSLKNEDIENIRKTFGNSISATAASKVKIPVKYSILNPVDIECQEAVSYTNPVYRKLLTEYELGRLRKRDTPQDKHVFNSLPEDAKKQILDKKTSQVYVNFDSSLIKAVFNEKMDYENFAIPLTYSVLDSLEAKTQLMKMDMAVVKTCQHAVLLITHGYEGKNGNFNYNQKITETLQTIFSNESVGRVLVTDFTVKGEFLIPNIAQLLSPQKYEVIQRDLEEGLGHILFGGGGGEKFSNQHAKVKIFIERLRNAREVFLEDFLNDEIINICKELGFRDIPTAQFEDIDLEDSNEYKRIVTQLAQFGYLTPEETFDAIETKKFPTVEDSIENQKKFKELKEDGLYEPITNSAKKEEESGAKQPNGRPPGVKTPLKTKKVSPIGTGNYSLSKIKDNLLLASKLENEVISQLKKKHKIKGDLNDNQKEIVDGIVNIIISDQDTNKWLSSIADYIKSPIPLNKDRQNELLDITYDHQVNDFIGGILLNSKSDVAQPNNI